MTIRKKYTFYLYDKDFKLIDFLAQKVNLSEFVKQILTEYSKGELIPRSNEDLQRKKMETDIRYKEVMIKIKEKELLYQETFDNKPSYMAKKVIKTAIENQNEVGFEPPEEKDLDEIIKLNWNKFIQSLRVDNNSEWTITCRDCDTGFILPTKESAILRFKQHLREAHEDKLRE